MRSLVQPGRRQLQSLARICLPSPRRIGYLQSHRWQSSMSMSEVESFLAKPTWSVRSLLPSAEEIGRASADITPKQLRHLLRLSALPMPRDAAEEQSMIATLASQLHFVRAVQGVDTEGVKPLRSLRDETAAGERAQTIGLKEMEGALAKEKHSGRYHKRIRRRRDVEVEPATKRAEGWAVLEHAERKVGRYFLVEGAPRQE